MGDMKVNLQGEKAEPQGGSDMLKPLEQPRWETPKMEDVSEQVMAQPYIRFT